MKPEEHTSHCAGDISLQKAKTSMVASEFHDLGDLWHCDPSHPLQKGPQTPCWRTQSFHSSLLCVHLPRQKHHISEFEHSQRHIHIVIWTHHTPTISHRSLHIHLQQPVTLLWIQVLFSSPLCITATNPEPCSSAWFIWAHLVKINTKEGNPLGWLNNKKKFGCRTPSHLCALLILHHSAATLILSCQKVQSSFHHKYLELENYSKAPRLGKNQL